PDGTRRVVFTESFEVEICFSLHIDSSDCMNNYCLIGIEVPAIDPCNQLLIAHSNNVIGKIVSDSGGKHYAKFPDHGDKLVRSFRLAVRENCQGKEGEG